MAPPRRERSSPDELAERVSWVRTQVAKGTAAPGALEAKVAKRFDVDSRTARRYIAKAREGLAQVAKRKGKASGEADPVAAAQYAALGAPPESALDGIAWMQRALNIAVSRLLAEEGLSNKELETRLVKIASTSSKFVPLLEITTAKDMVIHDAEQRDNVDVDPELSDVASRDSRSLRG